MSKTNAVMIMVFVVVAVSAVVSSSASAQWLVNGTSLAGLETLATTAESMENATLTFGAITITCKGKNVEEVSPMIESPNKLSAGSVKFTECSVSGENCALVGTTIATVPVVGEVTLEGALATRSVFSPKTKNTFTTIVFSGEKCAIAGETQSTTGKFTVIGPTGQDPQVRQEAVVNSASGEVKVGLTAATLKGKDLVKLANGLPFNFM